MIWIRASVSFAWRKEGEAPRRGRGGEKVRALAPLGLELRARVVRRATPTGAVTGSLGCGARTRVQGPAAPPWVRSTALQARRRAGGAWTGRRERGAE